MSRCDECYKVFCHRSKPVSCTNCGGTCHTTCTLQRTTGRVCRSCGSSSRNAPYSSLFEDFGRPLGNQSLRVLLPTKSNTVLQTNYEQNSPQPTTTATPTKTIETTNTVKESAQLSEEKFVKVDKELDVMRSKIDKSDDFCNTLQQKSTKLDADVDGLRKEISHYCEKLKSMDSSVQDISQCLKMLLEENKESKVRVRSLEKKANALAQGNKENMNDIHERVQNLQESFNILKVNVDGLSAFRYNTLLNKPTECDIEKLNDKYRDLNNLLATSEKNLLNKISRLQNERDKEKKNVIIISAVGFLFLTCVFVGKLLFTKN